MTVYLPADRDKFYEPPYGEELTCRQCGSVEVEVDGDDIECADCGHVESVDDREW